MADLEQLASLIREHNRIGERIASIIGRPALTGHLGEFLAREIFDIDLASSANNRASDGIFRNGSLRGKSVNVKAYPKRESLDLCVGSLPDYYLALTGPRSTASSSRRASRPFVITHVYLFEALILHAALTQRRVKIGVGSSVKKAEWDAAEIYPKSSSVLYLVSEAQRSTLALFAPPNESF
jgi:hypothetical protein